MTRLDQLAVAVRSETTIFVRARVPAVTAAMLVVGIAGMSAAMVRAGQSGDPAVAAKFGPLLAAGDWPALLGAAAQITAVAAMLGFGITVAWLFGREFTDGTVTGFYGGPIGRTDVALAKLVVFVVWSAAVSVGLAAALLGAGMALGFGWPATDAGLALARQAILGVLTAILTVPAALVATLGRTVLAGVALMAGLAAVSQIAVVLGADAWFTFAAPALWAVNAGVSAVQLALVFPVAAIFAGLTLAAWGRLQLDH